VGAPGEEPGGVEKISMTEVEGELQQRLWPVFDADDKESSLCRNASPLRLCVLLPGRSRRGVMLSRPREQQRWQGRPRRRQGRTSPDRFRSRFEKKFSFS
jgi:hypothetical protein